MGHSATAHARRALPGAIALAALALALPAFAQSTAQPAPEPAPADDYPPPEEAQPAPDIAPIPTTTLATGAPQPTDRLTRTLTVLTREDIERSGGFDPLEVLRQIPGFALTRAGGPGAATIAHVDGGSGDDVLVMLDGIRLSDLAAPGGGFDFGTLNVSGIERIDVLRGSEAVAWGSGATAGVIALKSAEFKGIHAGAELGSRDSFAGNLDYGVRRDRYALSLGGGYVTSDGIPDQADDAPGGFHQWRVSGHGHYDLARGLSLTGTARYVDSKLTGNAFALPPDLAALTPAARDTELFVARTAAHYDRNGVVLDAGYAVATTRTAYLATAGSGSETATTALGRSERADLVGTARLPAGFSATLGLDNEWLHARLAGARARARITGEHLELGWYDAVATFSGGVRHDDHSAFGGHDSYDAGFSVKLLKNVRVRAAYAEAFKAPTLVQLDAAYGNRALRPETTQSYEAGVDYSGQQDRVRFDVALYRRDSRDLIALDGPRYANIAAARAEGGNLAVSLVPTEKWRLSLGYAYVHAFDRTPLAPNSGRDLPHDPRHVLSASADWTTPWRGLIVGADLAVRSASYDDAANAARLGASEQATLRALLPIGNFIDFYGRIENLLNDHTPTIGRYGSVGRGVFAGVKVRI